MLDRAQEYFEFVMRWLRAEVGAVTNFQLCLLAALLAAMCVILYRTTDRRYLEGKMARKKEREAIAKWLSSGLDDGIIAGDITPEQRDKYNKKIGKSFGLPDMIPGRKKPDQNKTKLLIRQRLHAMGVDIAEKLYLMRRTKTPKRVKPVPKSVPLPLP